MPDLELSASSPPASFLCDYLPEAGYCAERGITRRTARGERQRGVGPPYIRLGNAIFYPRPGLKAFLKSIEQQPVRRTIGRGPAA